jgi:plasmid segregation protein ParM
LLKDARLKGHLAKPSRQANALGQYIYGEAQIVALKGKMSATAQ